MPQYASFDLTFPINVWKVVLIELANPLAKDYIDNLGSISNTFAKGLA